MSCYTRAQLAEYAALTADDLAFVQQCRGSANRLGCAYQIAFVRLTNRFPAQQPLELIEELLAYVGAQVDIDPDHISAYEHRQQTISEHQARIRRHLRLLAFGDDERKLVEAFLFEQCCRLEQIAALRAQAEQFFRDQRILQPATSTLDRMIGEQRRQARAHLFERVMAMLPAELMEQLSSLLQVADNRKSDLQAIKEPPGLPCPAAVARLIRKLELIEQTGALQVDLSWLHNNYQRSLARYAQRCSVYRLRDLEPTHRYTTLLCFLGQTHHETVDQLIDLQDKLVTKVCNRAQGQCDEALRQRQQSMQRSLEMFQRLAAVVLDETIEAGQVREAVFRQLPREELVSQLEEAGEWLDGRHRHMFPGVVRRFEYVRRFFPALLKHLHYEGQGPDEEPEVLRAVEVLKAMNGY